MLATVCNRHRRVSPMGVACPECAAETERHEVSRRSRNNVTRGRNSAHWRRIRDERLRLAEGECEKGLPGCTGEAATVDLLGGGDHSHARLEDTEAACRHCHGVADGGRR